jgi:hypothetical protein
LLPCFINASPKLAIQWISTRGAWLLESLTKAFAYIGTTTKADQSVAKVLAGYSSLDLPVATPTIADLQQRLTVVEYGQLVTLRDELYHHVLGFQDARFNVALPVVDATMASLLMHLKTVLAATSDASTTPAFVSRYLYALERAIGATNARLGCCISSTTCSEWGGHLRAHWQAMNHAQVGDVVAGRDTLLSSTLQHVLSQLVSINERLARIEDVQARLCTHAPRTDQAFGSLDPAPAAESIVVPAPATSSTLAGCLLNWYTSRIWNTVRGKKEQNKRADTKAAVNILMVLYQAPFTVPAEPPRSDSIAYEAWKQSILELALKMDRTANERLHSFDHKNTTRKASSMRECWRQLQVSHPEAQQALAANFLALKGNGAVVDSCTPLSHLWGASELS